MKLPLLSYQENFRCECGEVFLLLIPIYIILFKRNLADEARKQYKLGVLRHNVEHMEGRLHGQATRSKSTSNHEHDKY